MQEFIINVLRVIIALWLINVGIIDPIFKRIRSIIEKKTLTMIDIVDGYNKAKEYIDTIVADALQEYILLNPNVLANGYITSEEEDQIRDQVKLLVVDKISNSAMTILSTYYDDVSKILGTRIYIAITDFISSNNIDRE